MKFSEKLQTLRKERKLSQEQLAEMLDVSRQAVSKWESGQSYPEMDKLLSLCKIFKVSLEELTNEDIKELNVDSKSKNVINSMIDQVVNFINRTFKMVTTVSPKVLGKCIVETLILLFVLSLCKSPFMYIDHLLDNIIKYLPNTIYHIFSSTFYLILMVVYLALVIIILFYYFDRRWLQRYENNELNEYVSEEDKEDSIKTEKKSIKEDKVIIRRQSGLNKIFTVLGEIIVLGIKIFAFFMLIPFCFLLIFACMGICINVLAILKGVFYFGPLLCMIFGITLISMILEIFFNFILNRKTNFNRLFITFIIGLVGIGIGAGITTIEIFNTKVTNEPAEVEQVVEKKEFQMNDKLFFMVNSNPNISYQTDENIKDKVIFELSYSKDFTEVNMELESNMIYINSYFRSFNSNKGIFNIIIEDLKDKTLHDYNNLYRSSIKVISSSSNIEKLKSNYYNYTSGGYVDTGCSNYENEKRLLTNEVDSLEKKIINQENINLTQKDKIDELELKLDKYKTTLKGLLGE